MGSKILVIDDDAGVRREVTGILEDAGYKVAEGRDGREALSLVRDEHPDLIVMDVEMPGMGGREACRIIKGNKNFGFIPIILVTARDDVQSKVEGLELGADDYLVKPLNRLELTARVKSMLRLRGLQLDLLQANERLQHVNDRLQELSMTDPLTGLCNRLFFQKRVLYEYQRAERYQNPMALLMLDLDHFKRINDKHGHPFGDHVLKEVARLLINNLRGVDIVARYGGEEIVVVCPETNREQATIVAERIRSACEKLEIEKDATTARVTTSIGVAICPHEGVHSEEDLLQMADQALYAAKQAGRNCVRFASDQEP